MGASAPPQRAGVATTVGAIMLLASIVFVVLILPLLTHWRVKWLIRKQSRAARNDPEALDLDPYSADQGLTRADFTRSTDLEAKDSIDLRLLDLVRRKEQFHEAHLQSFRDSRLLCDVHTGHSGWTRLSDGPQQPATALCNPHRHPYQPGSCKQWRRRSAQQDPDRSLTFFSPPSIGSRPVGLTAPIPPEPSLLGPVPRRNTKKRSAGHAHAPLLNSSIAPTSAPPLRFSPASSATDRCTPIDAYDDDSSFHAFTRQSIESDLSGFDFQIAESGIYRREEEDGPREYDRVVEECLNPPENKQRRSQLRSKQKRHSRHLSTDSREPLRPLLGLENSNLVASNNNVKPPAR
ncbi:MAG: hypothetical protein M1819_002052 [Sarea resinae]|nr:MAG: hypothetical protein M1819_002052 [Sarea resinae]